MRKYLRLAYRNITRHKRRSLLTILLIGSVVAISVFMEGFIEGNNQGWRSAIIHSQTGHIQILPAGSREISGMASLDKLIDTPDRVKALMEGDEAVIGLTEQLEVGGMIATENKTAIFSGIGIDPVNEYDLFDLMTVSQGKRISPLDKEGCVMGTLLAKQLGLTVGDSAVLMTNTVEGAINAVRVNIIGLFESGEPQVDSMFLYIPLAHAQALGNVQGKVSKIILLLDDIKKIEPYVRKLKDQIKTIDLNNALEVWPWDELATMYKRITGMQRFQLSIAEGIMALLVVLAITIIMLMSVFERVREIGTLNALGISRREVLFLFLTEAAMIGFIGGFFGAILGTVITMGASIAGIPFNPPGTTMTVYIRPIVVPSQMMVLWGIALVTTLVGGLYPALRGSAIKPTEALRYV